MPLTEPESIFLSSAIGAIVSVPFVDSNRNRAGWSLEFDLMLAIAYVLVQINALEADAGSFWGVDFAGTAIAAASARALAFGS